MRVAVDIDEVLAEYYQDFITWHSVTYGDPLPPLDEWETTDIGDYLDVSDDEKYERINAYMDAYLHDLEPKPGAEQAIQRLRDDVSFVAITRRPEAYLEDTWLWLIHTFGDVFDAVECTTHLGKSGVTHRSKGKLCVAHDVDVFIDDTVSHVEDAVAQGVFGLVMRRPWNAEYAENNVVSSWQELVTVIQAVQRKI